MALTVLDSGTLSLDGTEQTVDTVADKKAVLVFRADFGALVGGATPDTVILRIKSNILAAGTERLLYEQTFVGGLLVTPIVEIPYVASDDITITLHKTAGTNRDIPWSNLEQS